MFEQHLAKLAGLLEEAQVSFALAGGFLVASVYRRAPAPQQISTWRDVFSGRSNRNP
ncbi:MAG: hypothetical protein R3C68_01650 [Myxococcota bacterium]